jgi:hypothetical protein
MKAILKIHLAFLLALTGTLYPHIASAQWNTNTYVNLEISGLITAAKPG